MSNRSFTLGDVELSKDLVRHTPTGKFYRKSFSLPGATMIGVRDLADFSKMTKVDVKELQEVTPGDKIPFAIMLTETTEGLRGGGDNTLVSTDLDEVYQFLQRNSQTMGFTIQFGINTDTNVVFEIMRKGRLNKKTIKVLIERFGITQWVYSWAFAGKWFLIDGELVPLTAVLDLTTGADVNDWLHALYGKTIDPRVGSTLKIEDQVGWDRFVCSLK